MAEIIYDQYEPVGRRFKIKISAFGTTMTFNLGDVEYTTGFQTDIEKLGFEYWQFLHGKDNMERQYLISHPYKTDEDPDLPQKIKCARILYLSKEYQQRLARFEKLAQRNDLEGDLLTKVRTYLEKIALRDKSRCSFKNSCLDYVLDSEDRFQFNLEKIMKEIEK